MNPFETAKRVVIKLGTGVLTSGIGELDENRINALCRQIVDLRARGIQVVVVSSGAVGLGMGRLQHEKRPKDLASLQACAAVGQSILINTWQRGFDPHEVTVAQILLTREDLRAKHRHNAIFDTVERLLAEGVVPVVNENDTVSAAEIKFGDNDTLSALVASIVNADLLFILSNVPGLIDREGTGEVVTTVEHITPEIEAMAGGTTDTTAVGGMVSKLTAAKIAHRAGCGVYIASGKDEALFEKLISGEATGTYFVPSNFPVKSHKRWIAIQDSTAGTITVDEGAAQAIVDSGKSLLTAGVTACEGDFPVESIVKVVGPDGSAIALGQTEMGASAIAESITGKVKSEVAIHRDNLVLLD